VHLIFERRIHRFFLATLISSTPSHSRDTFSKYLFFMVSKANPHFGFLLSIPMWSQHKENFTSLKT
jgi:hypothetical protein